MEEEKISEQKIADQKNIESPKPSVFSNKHMILIITIVIVAVFILVNVAFGIFMYKKSQSRQNVPSNNKIIITPAITPIPTQIQTEKTCVKDSDCPQGSTCVTTGPIIANQPPHKVCSEAGKAVPL